jgi:DNA-binding transcriptional MerR regulator
MQSDNLTSGQFSGLLILQKVIDILLKHGFNKEDILNRLKESETNFQEKVGKTALFLVGEDGVEKVKEIQNNKNMPVVEAVYEYLSSDPQKLEKLKGEIKNLQAEAVQNFIESILDQTDPTKAELIAIELESLNY